MPAIGGSSIALSRTLVDDEVLAAFAVSPNDQTLAYLVAHAYQAPFVFNIVSIDGTGDIELPSPLAQASESCGHAFSADSSKFLWCEKLPGSDDMVFSVVDVSSPTSVTVLNAGIPIKGRLEFVEFDVERNLVFIQSKDSSAQESEDDIALLAFPLSGTALRKLYSFDSRVESSDLCGFKPSFDVDKDVFVSCKKGDEDFSLFVQSTKSSRPVGIDTFKESGAVLFDFKVTGNADGVLFMVTTPGIEGSGELYWAEIPEIPAGELCIPIKTQQNKLAVICL